MMPREREENFYRMLTEREEPVLWLTKIRMETFLKSSCGNDGPMRV